MTKPTGNADDLTIEAQTGETANDLITAWFGLTNVEMNRGALARDATKWG